MNDRKKNKDQLIKELQYLRKRVTELKKAETKGNQALHESEVQYKAVLDAVPDMMFQISKDGTYLDFIPAKGVAPLLLPKEFLGKKLTDLLPKNLSERAMASIKCVLKTGQPQTLEYQIIQNSEPHDYESRMVVSGPDKVLAIVREITSRKMTEAALLESEKKYRMVVGSSNEAIFIVQNDHIKFFNAKALKLTGYRGNDLTSRPYLKLFHPQDREFVAEKHSKEISEKSSRLNSLRIIDKLGKVKWVELTSTISEWHGEPAYLWFLKDITEQKRLQEELARVQRLETAGRVAGQIAHDFNNLLSPLAAYPVLIREQLPEGHPTLEMLDEMEDSAKKIAEINQQLLALGRRGHYAMEPIDFHELLHGILTLGKFPKEIVIKEAFTPDIFSVKGGAAQLTRALTNLINNAIEAMNNQGVLTVKTENTYLDIPLKGYQTIDRGEYVKLSISDTGSGIRPEIIDNIFDPFFTTKKMDRRRGSGLGLSIVHGIVEDHNGYIQVDSKPGKGTTFSLYFPVNRAVEREILINEVKSASGDERILIVDDDPIQRRVAGQLLRRLGYRVQVVSSGETAVTHLKKRHYDLLIVDMVMDGIDGVEAYKRILEFEPKQKAIILSGYAMSNRVQTAIKLGAGSFVTKPISQKVLANAVRKELDKKHGRRRN